MSDSIDTKLTEEQVKFLNDNEKVIREIIKRKEQLEKQQKKPESLKVSRIPQIDMEERIKPIEEIKNKKKKQLNDIITQISLKDLDELVKKKETSNDALLEEMLKKSMSK